GTNIAWSRNRVEPPDLFAAGCVQGVYASAHAVFTARHTSENQPVEVARCASDAIAVVVVLELCPPQRLAGLLVNCDETAVELAGVNSTLAGRDAAVVPTATNRVIDLRNVRVVLPDLAAGLRIQR